MLSIITNHHQLFILELNFCFPTHSKSSVRGQKAIDCAHLKFLYPWKYTILINVYKELRSFKIVRNCISNYHLLSKPQISITFQFYSSKQQHSYNHKIKSSVLSNDSTISWYTKILSKSHWFASALAHGSWNSFQIWAFRVQYDFLQFILAAKYL